MRGFAGLLAGMMLFVVLPVFCQEKDPKKEPAKEEPIAEAKSFVSQHSGRFDGKNVEYTATASETYLKNDKDKEIASIFSIAYVRSDVKEISARPVIFIFNGGPGSASLWLHMGAFGPKRVVVPSDARDDGAPPYPIIDNESTPLDIADLVFIDPVGTGYSRPLGGADPQQFWGVREDAKSVSDFVRLWITKNKRWNSPKYIMGESYGTMRAAAMAIELEGFSNSVGLNGLVLISNFMDFTGATFQPGNEMGYITYLPSYAATAWYHGKVSNRPESLDLFVEEARQFALGEYAHGLLLGNRLDAQSRASLRAKLAHFTGLSEDYLEKADLRVNYPRFMRELLRDEGKVLGRLDSRYVGEEVDDVGEFPTGDPAGAAIGSAFTAAIYHHLTTNLGVEMDRPYQTSGRVGGKWNWKLPDVSSFGDPVPTNTAPYVGRAMRQNKDLRVLVVSGYYDFATPFFDAENNFSRNGVVKDRLFFSYYEAGHMMYLHQPSFDKLMSDVREFLLAGAE